MDMAKELCMVENNDKGKKARRYFIEKEKELKKLEKSNNDQVSHLRIPDFSIQRKPQGHGLMSMRPR